MRCARLAGDRPAPEAATFTQLLQDEKSPRALRREKTCDARGLVRFPRSEIEDAVKAEAGCTKSRILCAGRVQSTWTVLLRNRRTPSTSRMRLAPASSKAWSAFMPAETVGAVKAGQNARQPCKVYPGFTESKIGFRPRLRLSPSSSKAWPSLQPSKMVGA